jgi:hypothetical protein
LACTAGFFAPAGFLAAGDFLTGSAGVTVEVGGIDATGASTLYGTSEHGETVGLAPKNFLRNDNIFISFVDHLFNPEALYWLSKKHILNNFG